MKALILRRNVWPVLLVISSLLITVGHLAGQKQPANQPVKTGTMDLGNWFAIIGLLIGLVGVIFGVYQYRKRIKDAKNITRAEQEEIEAIRKEKPWYCRTDWTRSVTWRNAASCANG